MKNLSGTSPAKRIGFEYIIYCLIEWYKNLNQIKSDADFNSVNDFSKLKVLKLHFFVSAINSNNNSLLALFNHFYAMPYGHVESDLYNLINSNGLVIFEFLDGKIIIRRDFIDKLSKSFSDLDPIIRAEIDTSVELLKLENNNLVNYKALELVDLSHMWLSWKAVFDVARSSNKYSEEIPSDLIKSEPKVFLIPR